MVFVEEKLTELGVMMDNLMLSQKTIQEYVLNLVAMTEDFMAALSRFREELLQEKADREADISEMVKLLDLVTKAATEIQAAAAAESAAASDVQETMFLGQYSDYCVLEISSKQLQS